MATTSAIAIAAAYHTTVDPQLHPYPYSHPAMHGLGLPTSHIYSHFSSPDQYEALLGRKLAPTPAHLTARALYVPSHNDKATHLPVYDFTRDYKATVRNEPIGSSRYKTSFGLMPKPNGDGRGSSEVSYLVDFEPLERRRSLPGPDSSRAAAGIMARARRKSSLGAGAGLVTRATVSRRMLYGGADVALTIPPALAPLENGDMAYTMTPSSTGAGITVAASFPLPPTAARFGSSRNAWFTFTVPGVPGAGRTLQWQVHPVEHGLLRYSLVELVASDDDDEDAVGEVEEEEDWWAALDKKAKGKGKGDQTMAFSAADQENEHRIRAIYHNVGLGFSLSQPFSEGALLLQEGLDPELEALIVASLLGLLWRARGEDSKPRKSSKPEGGLIVAARKKSVDGSDVTEVVSRPAQTRRSKSLIGKILRKK